ncbi:MAG: tRNA 4-thiouridine(8) synthase ThiI [Candidatus Micrarchaeota archaeon]|nr:tRNA 4-thiouridine(8) synthase ThiI [Candidatus Micrarchaeota archaeon]MDE1859997.1 tRNA 4-thiouridine(8) synthase ThiI [Candidatus Micrarchaeota archaeon]
MPDPDKLLIVHYGELWLRGRNRGTYIKQVKRNIYSALQGENVRFEKSYDRVILRLSPDSDTDSIKRKISKVFGISAYEVAFRTKPDLKHIVQLSVKLMKDLKGKKIKINSHRSYKGFKFNSMDIIEKVATAATKAGLDPHLKGYDAEIFISVAKDEAYIYTQRYKALGGLPAGTSGKAVILLSGGIDSPVAAWYAMKRGLEPIYVHVHGFADNNEAAKSKLSNIIGMLSAYSPSQKTYYVPSHIFQMSAIKSGRYELILLKSFMLKLAERIAKKEGAECIITGESLGQVASQTSSNLAAEEYGIDLPVLRPLVGFDKHEIIKVAADIGTYSESIKPYKDVCSINSKNPATRTRIDVIKDLSKKAKLNEVVTRSLKLSMVKPSPVT